MLQGGSDPVLEGGDEPPTEPPEDDDDPPDSPTHTVTADPRRFHDNEPPEDEPTEPPEEDEPAGKHEDESDRAFLTRTGAEQEDDVTSVEGEDKTVVSGVDITGDEDGHGADGIASREQSRTSREVDITGDDDGHGADGIASRENSATVESPHTTEIDHSDEEDEVKNPMTSPYATDQTMDPDDLDDPAGDDDLSEEPWYDPDGDGDGDDLVTEPDWDGDGEPGGPLFDNDKVPDTPDLPDPTDWNIPWWIPWAVIGAVGTVIGTALLLLLRPYVAAFSAVTGGSDD